MAGTFKESMHGEFEEWLRFLGAHSHILRENPWLLFQQAANQPDITTPAQAASRRFEAGLEKRPWLRWVNKRQRRDPCLMALSGHTDDVQDCAYGPDGRKIVSASADCTLKVWDAVKGSELMTLTGHTAAVKRCLFSPDGRRIVSASGDSTLRIWDAATGTELAVLRGHATDETGSAYGRLNSFGLSADGTHLISWGGLHHAFSSELSFAELKLWDALTGELIANLTGHIDWIHTCAFSPDGRRIASASDRWDKTLKVWDSATGRELLTLEGHTAGIRDCVFAPDGRSILSVSEDKTLRWWDAESGSELAKFSTEPYSVLRCAFSSDGRQIAAGWPVKIWDANTHVLLSTLEDHDFLYSHDGSRIVSWRRSDPLVDANLPCKLSPDGTRMVSAARESPTTIKVFDVSESPHEVEFHGHSAQIQALAFAPDGRRFASGAEEEGLIVWDAGACTGQALQYGKNETVKACAFAPGARLVASASRNRMLQFWDADSGGELLRLAFLDPIEACLFSPDGQQIVTAPYDSTSDIWTLAVWELSDGKKVAGLGGHKEDLSSCAVAPDGRQILSASRFSSNKEGLKLWSIENKACVATFEGHEGGVTACAFSPGGERIVSGGSDHTVRLWDARNFQALDTLDGHKDAVTIVAFSPDGRLILSAAEDGFVKIWDAYSGALICEYVSSPATCAAAWSPDRRRLVIGHDRHPHLLQLENVASDPLIITGWRLSGPTAEKTIHFGCPSCREWSEEQPSQLGNEVYCAHCHAWLKLNPFTLDADWRQIAQGWRGEPARWPPEDQVTAWPRYADWGWFSPDNLYE